MKSLKVGLSMLMLLGMTAMTNAQEEVYQNPQHCLTDAGSLAPNAAFLGNYTTVRTNVDVNGDGFISPAEKVVVCDDTLAEALTEDRDDNIGDDAS